MTAEVTAERTFRAMNTEWWLRASRPSSVRADLDLALAEVESLVHDAEARYSRFLEDSLLSELNRVRLVRDTGFAALAREARRFHEATRGAFDATIGAALVAAGYDRSFERLGDREPVLPPSPPEGKGRGEGAPLRLVVRGDTVALEGEGTLDLGGIAKGWTVDRAGEALEARGIHDYLVDGGGDIRARGLDGGQPWGIEVGDGLVVTLCDRAVATSSTLARRWRTTEGDAHHILTPESGRPAAGPIVTAVVVAAETTTADVLATSIIASPERGLAALAGFAAEALLRDKAGVWTMTPGFADYLAAAPVGVPTGATS